MALYCLVLSSSPDRADAPRFGAAGFEKLTGRGAGGFKRLTGRGAGAGDRGLKGGERAASRGSQGGARVLAENGSVKRTGAQCLFVRPFLVALVGWFSFWPGTPKLGQGCAWPE
jgi:hypothetical protein